MFLSGFIGLQWTAGGFFDDTIPILAALLLAGAAFVLLGSSLAIRKSVALGLLEEHLNHCVTNAVSAGGEEADAKLAEASAAIARLVRA